MKMQDFAHLIWQSLVQPGDTVIDATVGNGHDTLFLAKLLMGQGHLFAYDIQPNALINTKSLLEKNLSEALQKPIELILGSHDSLKPCLAKLIVYNLGYLPGSDKSVTTTSLSTLRSAKAALLLLCPGGAISFTCYIGHLGGKEEFESLYSWASMLSSKDYSVSHHSWLNREKAPSLLLISRNH